MPDDNRTRIYRHATTGELAHLTVRAVGGSDSQAWCVVTLERPDGRVGRIAGQHQVEWWPAPHLALHGYRCRVRALRAAGYQRVG